MLAKVALIGYGYWGSKLARILDQLGVLQAILDIDPDRLIVAGVQYPQAFRGVSLDEVRGSFDAVAIATPPETHYALACQALAGNLHTFVEKPLATTYKEAKAIEDMATEKGLTLRTGHTYLHCPGILNLPHPLGRATLFVRLLNPGGGPNQTQRSLKWAALPHAVSLALHIFQDMPDQIEVVFGSESRIRLILSWWRGLMAYLDVGDNTGIRERCVELHWGNTRYIVDIASAPFTCEIFSGTKYRSFTSWDKPHVNEPLKLECEAFLIGDKSVDTLGSRVVKLIESIPGLK